MKRSTWLLFGIFYVTLALFSLKVIALAQTTLGGGAVGINNPYSPIHSSVQLPLATGALTIPAGSALIYEVGPTISSGFGTSPSVVNSNGSLAFTINVGTGGTATSGVIGLASAPHGWACFCTDITTNNTTVFVTKQTASAVSSCTVGNFSDVAVAGAWAASDILACTATAY